MRIEERRAKPLDRPRSTQHPAVIGLDFLLAPVAVVGEMLGCRECLRLHRQGTEGVQIRAEATSLLDPSKAKSRSLAF